MRTNYSIELSGNGPPAVPFSYVNWGDIARPVRILQGTLNHPWISCSTEHYANALVDRLYTAHSKGNGKERTLHKLDPVVSLSVSHPPMWSPWTYGADFVLSLQVIECVHVVFHDSLLDPYSSQFLQLRGFLQN